MTRRNTPSGFCVAYPVFSRPFVGTIVCHHTSVGSLPRAAFSGSHESRRHVGLAVHRGVVEVVPGWVLHVHEDRVVLRWPLARRPGAVVVGPDDLVEEALAAEERVERDLRVVRLAEVEVQVERALGIQQPPCLAESRLEEAPVVGERVVVARQVALDRLVAAALESDAGAVGRLCRGGGAARLRAAGVERRVEVDQAEGCVGQLRDDVEVVAAHHEVRSVGGPHVWRLTGGRAGDGGLATRALQVEL